MIGLLTIIAIGFLLGMRHATDPDHVIAVSTIVTREHDAKRSVWIGLAWGLGHTFTIVAVGGAIILFRITLSARIGLAMELAVAVMLIILGLRNVRGMFGAVIPVTAEDAAGAALRHSHAHPHVEAVDDKLARLASCRLVRPLVVGIVHGLAGSAAIALLVLSTISKLRWAVIYLAVFGVGTILGMILITVMLGSTFAYGQRRYSQIGRHFAVAAGLISLAFGVFIAYQVGFVNGLFTGNINWVPR